MREATSGTTLPKGQFVWPNVAVPPGPSPQIVAPGDNYIPVAGPVPPGVSVPGARAGNGTVICTARSRLPVTGAGKSVLSIQAYVIADDYVYVSIENPTAAAATVASGADITFDIMVLPLAP